MAKQKISRREFLKGTAAAGLGLAATQLLGVAPAAFADAAYKPGKYQATAYGNLSYVTVECTFSETALESVEIISQDETPILFSQVQEKLIPAIVENQALGLDGITGASNSSRAVKEAIASSRRAAIPRPGSAVRSRLSPVRMRPMMWTCASLAAAAPDSWPPSRPARRAPRS